MSRCCRFAAFDGDAAVTAGTVGMIEDLKSVPVTEPG